MTLLKRLVRHTMMIASGILLVVGLETAYFHFFRGYDAVFSWYQPGAFLLTGFFCSMPGLLLTDGDGKRRSFFRLRIVLHWLLLFVVVIGMGFVFEWYSNRFSCGVIALAYLLVYPLVWIVTYWMDKKDVREINDALKTIQDDE